MSAASQTIEGYDKSELLDYAWRNGCLEYKLFDDQRDIYQGIWSAIADQDCLEYCVNTHRRRGKTFVVSTVTNEVSNKVPRSIMRFVAPFQVDLEQAILPIFDEILIDCPAHLKPRYDSQKSCYIYPNKSRIYLNGANNKRENRSRGVASHLNIIDEAGFLERFLYLKNSILTPQILTTGGTNIATSTPPESPGHEFVDWAKSMARDDRYIHRDIFSSRFDQKTIDTFAEQAGGYGSSTWRREYLAEFVIDEALALVPEWSTDDYVGVHEVNDKTAFWHRYECMDLGWRDQTVVLFGHYHFESGVLYVEDEQVCVGTTATTDAIAHSVKSKEVALGWRSADDKELIHVELRVADNNDPKMLYELGSQYGLHFHPTEKESLTRMLNRLRMWVKDGRIIVNPRCRTLIGCLEAGVWKSPEFIGREIGRTASLGHFDALMSLVYMVRNVRTNTNPVPRMFGYDPSRQRIPPHLQRPDQGELSRLLGSAFKQKRVI